MSEGKCAFCDFAVADHDDNEQFDVLEGEPISREEAEIFLTKMDDGGKGAKLFVSVAAEWDEEVTVDVGGTRGTAEIPTGYECNELFEIRFCPMCGREL